MDITIKRARYKSIHPKAVVLRKFKGELFEYNGLQFCIGFAEGNWMAIELQTGHCAASYKPLHQESDSVSIDKVKKDMAYKAEKSYRLGLSRSLVFMSVQGFTLPINEEIQSNDNKNP